MDAATLTLEYVHCSLNVFLYSFPLCEHTDTASRNEASLNDVLVYRWPNTSASTRLEEDGMMLEDDNNNKDNSNNDNNNDNNNDLNDLSRRGIPVIELGVPENFRTLDFSALDYSNERLERFVLRYVLKLLFWLT